MTEPRDLTVLQAAALMRKRKLTAEALLHSCAERIMARDGQVHAWVEVYAERALAEARAQDRSAKRGKWAGPLHGIPMGIKDIFDVQGMWTRAGTQAYPARVAERDADSVAALRAAGAIIIGKTETTAFAFGDPAPTRNPWNLQRTPGGSSSGSAASVADRMCLAALGSQTAGSVLRPASYNGVVGFKPSHGAISLGGVLPLAWSLDHVGCFTRATADAHLLWQLMRVGKARRGVRKTQRVPLLTARRPKRIWRMRGMFEQSAAPAALAALEAACRAFAKGGARIVESPLPPSFAGVLEAQHCLMAAEAASYHRVGFAERPQLYPPRITDIIREGLGIPAVDLVAAQQHRLRLIAELAPLLTEVDVALTPSTVGPAPTPETTGPRIFQAPWSHTGLPTVTLPARLAPDGLPLGVQLIAGSGQEDALLGAAAWCERKLGFSARPE